MRPGPRMSAPLAHGRGGVAKRAILARPAWTSVQTATPPSLSAPPADGERAVDVPAGGGAGHVPAVVVGWVQAGPLDDVQRAALKAARRRVRDVLARELPGFAWALPVVRRRDLAPAGVKAEPVDLLDAGAAERAIAGWDFALVVTAADLHARHRPFALATPSLALASAALSLARLDPGLRSTRRTTAERAEAMGRRLAALALHALGHLNGLGHEDAPEAWMHAPKTPADLDHPARFTTSSRIEIEGELADVADPRLEESSRFHRLGTAAFTLRALALGWADVADAVVQIRPWLFPFQLSKLTTAAFSTLVVLVITAEAWDLGTRQPPLLVAALSLVALFATSVYLVRKQNLLARRHGRGRTEQQVVTSASVVIALGLGMATTYGLLFGTTLVLGALFFDAEILAGWAASLGEPVGSGHVLTFAGFVAALGIGVGALGASFEEQTYFRYVAYVDEET